MKVNISCRLITLDIKDLYINIPISETLHITKSILEYNNITPKLIQELEVFVTLPVTFTNSKKLVAMGSSISGIIDELFLQHDVKLYMKHVLGHNSILYYIRYVVDIWKLINHNEVIEFHELLNTQFTP